jgi:hypothetical protein
MNTTRSKTKPTSLAISWTIRSVRTYHPPNMMAIGMGRRCIDAIGIGRRCIDTIIIYSNERSTFGVKAIEYSRQT